MVIIEKCGLKLEFDDNVIEINDTIIDLCLSILYEATFAAKRMYKFLMQLDLKTPIPEFIYFSPATNVSRHIPTLSL